MSDLWIYLAHVDLFPYVQQRHSDVLKDDVTSHYIQQHWFNRGINRFRMVLPSAWWSVYLSVDYNRSNPFELTEILFKNQELSRVKRLIKKILNCIIKLIIIGIIKVLIKDINILNKK